MISHKDKEGFNAVGFITFDTVNTVSYQRFSII